MTKLAWRARDDGWRKEVAEASAKCYRGKFLATCAELAALKSRKAVRFSVRFADALRKLAARFRQHQPAIGSRS